MLHKDNTLKLNKSAFHECRVKATYNSYFQLG